MCKRGETMNSVERVIYLRKKLLKMNQEDFSKRIGLKRSSLANIEAGYVNLTDRNIELICAAYNVNENWLRTGEGDPFNKLSEQEELASWMGSIVKPENDGETMQRIIRLLSQLEDDDWEAIKKIADKISELYKKKD